MYKSFIRPGPCALINGLSIVQSTVTSSKNYPLNPHKRPRLYSSPARFGFADFGRPPFAYGNLAKTLRTPELVGFQLCMSRHRSDACNAQKHAKDTEVSRQNRSRDINIKGHENHTFGFISRWLLWFFGPISFRLLRLFGSIRALWGGKTYSDLLKIEGDLEKVVEIVEDVAETTEKVATMTEEISEDIAEEFPQQGAINKAAHFIEHLSEEVIEKAHSTEEFIHKVISTEKTVETSIESAVEALEGLIIHKPAISKSDSNQGDQVTDTHKENTNSKSKL